MQGRSLALTTNSITSAEGWILRPKTDNFAAKLLLSDENCVGAGHGYKKKR